MPELIWEGKYDANGGRAAAPRVSLPFQTVETVNESAQDRQRSLDLFAGDGQADWRNRLIWGDKKYVLPVSARRVCRPDRPHLYRSAVRDRVRFLLL